MNDVLCAAAWVESPFLMAGCHLSFSVCSLAFVCKTLRVRQWGVGLEPYAGVTDMVSSEHEVISTLAYIFSGVCLLGIIIHPHMHCDQQKN